MLDRKLLMAVTMTRVCDRVQVNAPHGHARRSDDMCLARFTDGTFYESFRPGGDGNHGMKLKDFEVCAPSLVSRSNSRAHRSLALRDHNSLDVAHSSVSLSALSTVVPQTCLPSHFGARTWWSGRRTDIGMRHVDSLSHMPRFSSR